ncbi:lysophosphatidic acid phosphatase type 6-like [Sycon ciliatum]|uniref:lysophosphatidic acid phosphatase type 6-like n=1 Tax=Sycon ciliatum TaxID=27933 RepID=UPI0020AC71E3|eukprot:scpid68783/ scgid22397/ Acid phosphatase-like protein 2
MVERLRLLCRFGQLHARRMVGLFIALMAVALFVHLVTLSEQSQHLLDLCVGVPAAKYPEASRIDGYCNDVNSITVDSDDGRELACLTEAGEYHLVQVVGLYRHGQRAPLKHVKHLSNLEKFVCGLPSMGGGWSGLDDVLLKRLSSNGKGVSGQLTFPLHPGKGEMACQLGQMTSVGFQQLSALGEHFRRRYVESGVIAGLGKNMRASNVQVRSTAANRCMRSAAAFLTGLLTDQEVSVYVHVDGMFRVLSHGLHTAADMFKGVDLKCSRHLSTLSRTVASSSEYRAMVETKLEPVMSSYSKLLDTARESMPLLMEICDNVQNQQCIKTESKPSDCPDPEHCVSQELLHQTLAACDAAFALNYSLAHSKYLAHPLLQQIVLEMEKRLEQIQVNPTVQNYDTPFVLFFGHETTLLAVLTALHSFDGVWPPLASRLLFEVWRCRLPGCALHKVRILFNGKALQGELTDAQGFINFPAFTRHIEQHHSDFVRECSA